MPAVRPAGYSLAQIVLHWLIAALVLFQVVMGDLIGPAWRAFRRGTEASAEDLFAANVHVVIGIAILALAVLRVAIRIVHGVPPSPAGQGRLQAGLSHLIHAILYLVIFGMPISGAVAWFGGVEQAAEVHEVMKPVIVATVALHTLGALVQHFVKRSDVLTRMLRPERRAA